MTPRPTPSTSPGRAVHAALRIGGAIAVALLTWGSAAGAQESATEPDQRDQDARFEALMEGARLVGQFTVDTGQAEDAPRPDLYSVSALEKGEGDVWIFHYTMSYGSGSSGGNQGSSNRPATTFDIPVRVVWADDTPVLTMTEQAVEGLGTFTVRVMIHGDRYAGTWQHGAFGGHMWGRIEREQSPREGSAPAAKDGDPGAGGDGATPPAP
jgi:hypothetical protein